MLEHIQRTATKFITWLRYLSYEEGLEECGLRTHGIEGGSNICFYDIEWS